MQASSPSHFALLCGLVLAFVAVSGGRLSDPVQVERPVLLGLVRNVPRSPVSDTIARTPDGCASIHFAITASTVSAAFPDQANCGSGVVLRSTGGLSLERDSTHWRLSLRVAWLNKTGTAMTGSRRLILPADSGVVLLPIASYGVDPTPVNATGVIGSAAYWDVGGGTTASGSTGLDTLIVLDIPVGTEQLLLRMTGDNLALPVGRPPVPNGWWAPTDPTLAVANTDAEGETKVYVNFLAVRFSPTATAEQVRAALRSQDAVIVGGRSGDLLGTPSYLIQIPNPGSFEALKAVIVALAGEPGVSRIGMQYYGSTMVPRSRFPTDDPSLRRSSWTDTTGTGRVRSQDATSPRMRGDSHVLTREPI